MHLVVIDGAITSSGEGLRFHPARLTAHDVHVLREAIRDRVLRLFKRRGLFDARVIDNLKAWSHGGGFSVLLLTAPGAPSISTIHGGHAEVRVPAYDKAGRERLLRAQKTAPAFSVYTPSMAMCARPLFASERLTWIREGERLRYRLGKPDPKGQTELVLTPDEWLDRVAALIPPPRRHRHRYFGVLAPNSA